MVSKSNYPETHLEMLGSFADINSRIDDTSIGSFDLMLKSSIQIPEMVQMCDIKDISDLTKLVSFSYSFFLLLLTDI